MTFTDKRSKVSEAQIDKIRGQLLGWYDVHARELPWRAAHGLFSPAYHVWLSEIMLQQTTVTAVKPYYTKFLAKWPTVHDLAAADQADVMAAWAGLGYYARARNLHKCAGVVANELRGVFPAEQAALQKLPGIGDYTSAAIAAIAFNQPATVVDGNVERVMARLFNMREALPAAKKRLKALAHEFFDGFVERPGELAQAMMDLGAGVCIPKAPRCDLCPLQGECAGAKAGDPQTLPIKTKKKPRPQKYGYVYWLENERAQVLLHKRPEKGLLGGMIALPTSEWVVDENTLKHMGCLILGNEDMGYIDHVFTHFDLRLYLMRGQRAGAGDDSAFFWSATPSSGDDMPSLFQKAYKRFQEM